MGNKLRIYLGDTDGGPADFYRTDDANVPVPAWTKLSDSTPGTPGFSSYNYCSEQCSYDMPVASPPGRPDVVWVGGQMQYNEIFTAHPPSKRTYRHAFDKRGRRLHRYDERHANAAARDASRSARDRLRAWRAGSSRFSVRTVGVRTHERAASPMARQTATRAV